MDAQQFQDSLQFVSRLIRSLDTAIKDAQSIRADRDKYLTEHYEESASGEPVCYAPDIIYNMNFYTSYVDSLRAMLDKVKSDFAAEAMNCL